MQNASSSSGSGLEKMADVAQAIRALSVLINTAYSYQTSHAVFRRAMEERLPLFEKALQGVRELPVYFNEGQVVYATTAVEPGTSMFQKLAQAFESLGVKGISLIPGLSAADLAHFVDAMTTKADDIKAQGLQSVLDKAGVKTVREQKVKIGVLHDKKPAEAAKVSTVPKTPAPKDRSGLWEIDDAAINLDANPVEPAAPLSSAERNEIVSRKFRSFVHGILNAMDRREATPVQATEIIAGEFDQRLKERVEEVRAEHERRIRRLETVKDVVLKEMENLHLAAIVVDSDMHILGINELGKGIVGDIEEITEDSPLGQFVASDKERQMVEIDGVTRMAHLIVAVDPLTKEGSMLISLE